MSSPAPAEAETAESSQPSRLAPEERLIAAARRRPVDATPVWFMRQAGRCLADYRALRERYDVLTIAKTPELCARVTAMPVHEYGVDGAVMFADIMLAVEGMGVSLELNPDIGPIIHQPIRSMEDVRRLRVIEPAESVPFLMETIRMLRRDLAGRAALIGFSGAPFTLACYLVEGRPSRDYARAKALMLREPDTWAELMDRLSETVVRYLLAQVDAGAQVLQLFDSWVGALAPADFRRFVLPWTAPVFERVKAATDVPTIYFGTGNAALLPDMARAGSDIVSVDWRVDLADAWRTIGPDKGIQGNLDPVRPLAGWEPAQEGAQAVLEAAGGQPGHIFNLGHGVLPETNPDVLRRLVDFVHERTGGS